MPDLGHDLRFGLFLTPDAASPGTVLRRAQLAEDLGLDLLGIQDHPYQATFLDTWTLLSNLAARTKRITLVPDVINLPLRPPAVLAGAAATLDILSDGRVELGLGAGAFWDAITAMGGERRTAPESVRALEEAITVLRALWGEADGVDRLGRGVRFDGQFYQLHGARPGPAPAHPIGIWLGAYGPRMLRLTARAADGWLPSSAYAAPDRLVELTATLDAAAADTGRDQAAIRRVYNIAGRFTRHGAGTGAFFDGPPAEWADQLTDLALAHGVSGFILGPGADFDRDLRVFAEEVVPLVRRNVEQERHPDAGSGPVPAPARDVVEVAAGGLVRPDGSFDEASRPRSEKRDVSELTPRQRRAGQHLVDVHDHLRNELRQLTDVIDQVAAGRADPEAARGLINKLTMRQNYWTLGTFCASYCRLLTAHHTLEDQGLFVALRKAEESLAPVLTRLEREHEVIAEVLTKVDEALVAMIEDPARLDEVRDRVELLADQLLSHLGYEEEELVEPLGRFDILA